MGMLHILLENKFKALAKNLCIMNVILKFLETTTDFFSNSWANLLCKAQFRLLVCLNSSTTAWPTNIKISTIEPFSGECHRRICDVIMTHNRT